MDCRHHWVIPTPTDGDTHLLGACKYCAMTRLFKVSMDYSWEDLKREYGSAIVATMGAY